MLIRCSKCKRATYVDQELYVCSSCHRVPDLCTCKPEKIPTVLRCEKCEKPLYTEAESGNSKYICSGCNCVPSLCNCTPQVMNLNAKVKTEIDALKESFKIPNSTTLKLSPKEGTHYLAAVRDAFVYLNDDKCTYNRIEFRVNDRYFVIAKLKK